MPHASSVLKEMIRVRVDHDRCQGHSRCKALTRCTFHRPPLCGGHHRNDRPWPTAVMEPIASRNRNIREKATFGRLHSL